MVCTGHVLTFVADGTEVEVLRRRGVHARPDGRVVVGFGTDRGYAVDDFFADAATAGLRLDAAFPTWDLRPFEPTSEFLVAS